MLFVSCIAYTITLLVGTALHRFKNIKDRLITGGKKAGSRIWFALKIIRHKLLGRRFWMRVYALGSAP